MYAPQRHFSLHPGWLKLRLKILRPILILMLFCNVAFVDFSEVTSVFYAKRGEHASLYIYMYVYMMFWRGILFHDKTPYI